MVWGQGCRLAVTKITDCALWSSHNYRMCGTVTIDRIAAHIGALNQQERDVLELVTRKPLPKAQVDGVLRRIRTDREHLLRVMRDSAANGRVGVRWSALVANHNFSGEPRCW